jgi:hypothetical protein
MSLLGDLRISLDRGLILLECVTDYIHAEKSAGWRNYE